MEILLQGWKPACPKWLLFLSLSTAPSFLCVNICWGRWCCSSAITWDLRDPDSFLSQFRVCLVFGQLPKVSLLLFPSAQSVLCIWDFLSVILHLSYLCFDHLLADAIFYYVFTCSTRMSLDSIVIEIIILNIFNTVQLSFAFFFFPHERDLNVSTASSWGQCKHLLASLQVKCQMSTLHCGIDILLLFLIDCYGLNYFL